MQEKNHSLSSQTTASDGSPFAGIAAIVRPFFTRKMLVLIVLGFSSGMPLYLLINLIQAWLAKSGLNVKDIGLFALVMTPYPWKFLWAPIMDRFGIATLGRRRGWMLLTQALLLLAIGGMGMLDPIGQLGWVATLAFVIAFLSASQDIVIDAFSREILADEEQGLGMALKVNAYKTAALVPGALSLILADYLPWSSVFWITAIFMLPPMICVLRVKEPALYGAPPKNIEQAVVLPFKEFIARDGWQKAAWVLAFMFFYRVGDSMAGTLLTKCLIDIGFSLKQIGIVAKLTLFWGSIAGGIVGGVWMLKLGIDRALWIFGVLQASSSLGFALLVAAGPNPLVLGLALAYEAFTVGLGTTAFVAYLARTTDPRYAATQFALFTSLAAVPRTFAAASIGYLVAAMGWLNFFVLCFALAIPGLMMLFKIAPWSPRRAG